MTETIAIEQTAPEKDSKFKTILNKTASFYQKHERKIFGTALVLTTSAAVLMRLGLVQHDKFLIEKGLYDEYYDVEGLPSNRPVIENASK